MTKEEERELQEQLARLQQEHRDLDAAITALQHAAGIHVFHRSSGRGWPGLSPAMTSTGPIAAGSRRRGSPWSSAPSLLSSTWPYRQGCRRLAKGVAAGTGP